MAEFYFVATSHVEFIIPIYTEGMWWWKRKVHSSWNIALGSGAFVVGVACAVFLQVSFAWALAGALLTIWMVVISRVYVLPVIVLTGCLTGIGYGSAHLGERSVYAQLIGRTITLEGRVREDPSKSSTGSTSLQLDMVSVDGVALPGAVFVSVRSVRDVKRGDRVRAVGKAKEGFANFPVMLSVQALASVTRSPLGDIGRVVRDWFTDRVREVIPEPQASLGVGFLTGQKSALPTDLADALKVAGLTHIVVASGYNLTILVRMARKVFLRVSKFLSAVASSGMIMVFMAMTGLSPSMTRAGLVSGMSLMAWYYGRAFHPFVILPFSAALTVALQPSYVWGDMGWQLSFAAFAGVMVVAPLLQTYFFGSSEPGVFRQILGETIAAHIVTIPVIALSFGIVSNVAIIANLLVVPLVPLAMLLTFLCGVGVMCSLPFIWLLATPTSWLLQYMVNVSRFVADIPWAQSELALSVIFWVGYLVVVALSCLWMWRAARYNFRKGESML